MPVLNEADTINDSIENLRKLESIESCEIIIVDGAPEQDTLQAVHDTNIITVTSPPGRALQMNAGASAANGDILVFLHVDTVLPENGLILIRDIFKCGTYVGGAFDMGIDSKRLSLKIIAFIARMRSRMMRIPFGDQAIFLKRDYFNMIGGYKDMPLMEDVELMKRIKKRGDKISIIKKCILTSPRRWEREGILHCVLRNWWILLQYHSGVRPEKLAWRYRHGKNLFTSNKHKG